jgi:hypothetical protein
VKKYIFKIRRHRNIQATGSSGITSPSRKYIPYVPRNMKYDSNPYGTRIEGIAEQFGILSAEWECSGIPDSAECAVV